MQTSPAKTFGKTRRTKAAIATAIEVQRVIITN